MPRKTSYEEVPVDKLRWRLDPATLPFKSTDDLEPLDEIVGQERAVEAFKFGMGIDARADSGATLGQFLDVRHGGVDAFDAVFDLCGPAAEFLS